MASDSQPVAGTEPAVPASSAAAATPTAGVGRAPRAWSLRNAVLLLGLFGAGFLVSWLTSGPAPVSSPPGAHADLSQRDVVTPGSKSTKKKADPTEWQKAQQLLKERRFEPALIVYQTLAAESKGALPSSVSFRMALCYEELGQPAKALRLLQDAVAHGNRSEALAAQIVQARIHLRQRQPRNAEHLLWPIVLQAKRFPVDSPVPAEASYLLALALAQEVLDLRPTASLEPRILSASGLAPPADKQIEWLTLPEPLSGEGRPPQFALSKHEDSTKRVLERAETGPASAAGVLEAVAAAGELPLVCTDEAQHVLETRSLMLALPAMPWTQALEDIAASLDLTATVKEDRIELASAATDAPKMLAAQRLGQAKRRLATALQEQSHHHLAPPAYLALGHLESGKNDAAALAWHEQHLREMPDSALSLEVNFHRGILLRRAGKISEAQQAFCRVVDQAPAHPLAALALVHLGQLYLEQGDWRHAVSVLKRGELTSSDPTTRAATLLTQAAALLPSDQPRGALVVLAKNRETWPDESSRQLAVLLAAYARYLDAARNNLPIRESNELTIALLHSPAESLLGPYMAQILGSAYGELGMWTQAKEVYERALTQVNGPLAQAMTFRLGETLVRLHENEAARARLLQLSVSKSSWAHHAGFELAGLEFSENHFDACIARCRQLLQEPTSLRLMDVLTLMGRAYERQGNFADAARCLAGEIPE